MADLVCVDPEKIPQVWPFVSGMIGDALERAMWTSLEEVEADVMNRRALLWLVWDGRDVLAASVTQITSGGPEKVCTIVACGGRDRPKWLHLISEIENYAKEEGCARVRICGRRGWTRALEDYGVRAIVLEKAL